MLLSSNPLSSPTGVTATAYDDNTVDLHWTAAADVADPLGTAYEVQRQTPAGWASIDAYPSPVGGDAVDSTLAGATTNAYRVRAVAPADATLDSAYVPFDPVTTPLTQPAYPVNLSTIATTPGQVDLNWDPSTSIVTAYVITAAPDDGGTPVTRLAPGFVSAYTFAGLTAGPQYAFSVIAVNDQGNGNAVRSYEADTWAYAPPVPLAASAPATVAEGDTATLSLTSSTPAGSPIVAWDVTWPDTSWPVSVDGPDASATHPANAAGLTANIVAREADAQVADPRGDREEDNYGHSYNLPPVAIDVIPRAPSAVHAVVGSSTQINLDWTNNSRVADTVRVLRADAGSADYTVVADLPATATTYADTGLTPNTRYAYKVSSLGGQYSTTESAAVAPDPTPTGSPLATPEISQVVLSAVTVVPAGDGTTARFDLAWTYGGLGTDAALHYEVELKPLSGYYPTQNYAIRQTAPGGPGGSYTFSGEPNQLFEGLRFQVRVRADKADGTVTDYAETPPIDIPAVKPELQVASDPQGTSAVLLTWSYAAPAPTTFSIERRQYGSPLWITIDVVDGHTKSYLLNSYDSGVIHDYRIAAYSNGNGLPNTNGHQSIFSAPVTHETPVNQHFSESSGLNGLKYTIVNPYIEYSKVDDHTILITWDSPHTHPDYDGTAKLNTQSFGFYDLFRDPTGELEITNTYSFRIDPGQTSTLFTVTPGQMFVLLIEEAGTPSFAIGPDGYPHFTDLGSIGLASTRGTVGDAAPTPPLATAEVRSTVEFASKPISVAGNVVHLEWENTPNNEDNFLVYRTEETDAPNAAKPELIATLDKDVTKYDDKGVRPGDYKYTIVSKNKTGENSTDHPVNVWPAGYLAAFDGSGQVLKSNTNVGLFYKDYHQPGHGDYTAGAHNFQFDGEFMWNDVKSAYMRLASFYQDSNNRLHVPIDMVGWSRGCFEALALADLVAKLGIPKLSTLRHVPGNPNASLTDASRFDDILEYFPAGETPPIRFLGLISPVGQTSLLSELAAVASLGGIHFNPGWNTRVPAIVVNYSEWLDNEGIDPFFNQQDIPGGATHIVPDSHANIGINMIVMIELWRSANNANVPVPLWPTWLRGH